MRRHLDLCRNGGFAHGHVTHFQVFGTCPRRRPLNFSKKSTKLWQFGNTRDGGLPTFCFGNIGSSGRLTLEAPLLHQHAFSQTRQNTKNYQLRVFNFLHEKILHRGPKTEPNLSGDPRGQLSTNRIWRHGDFDHVTQKYGFEACSLTTSELSLSDFIVNRFF